MAETDDIAATIRADVGDDVEIHDSSGPEAVFVTTRSKIELALRQYRRGVVAQTRWVNPFVTAVTLLSVLVVADFDATLGFSEATWSAVFFGAFALSILWLGWELYTFARHRHHADIEFVIEHLERE